MSIYAKKRPYRVCGIYDTETANIKIDDQWHAYTVCYQVNDTRDVLLSDYRAGETDDIRIYRHMIEMLDYIDELCAYGEGEGIIPVIAGYNLLFDLQPILAALSRHWDMEVNAQSSTNVYTLDLVKDKKRMLRFWDTYHLEMRGLAAMGETAGLAKLKGDWDYSLIRTPETPLTQEEIGYAARDVQVIPAYLRYLLEANEWLTEDMFGCRVLTKTSLVRRMAEFEIGTLDYVSVNGKRTKLIDRFIKAANSELPGCYYDYAIRKACFRGGFTFTAAAYASKVVRNVASADVTSMHHTFINGRYIPEQFRPVNVSNLKEMCESVLSTSMENVLARYHKPFRCAFHARILFKNIRLRHGSAFDRWGIACIPRGKFGVMVADMADYSKSEAAQETERAARLSGWRDSACNATFAFGKLYRADACILHCSELELWTMAQVYEWDSYEPLFGEGTLKWSLPPDYITLQSNVLFARKQDMKHIVKNYIDHAPYNGEIPSSIPQGIAKGLREGTYSHAFIESYYSNTVKGMFNSIYGTQAQDVYKADYEVEDDGIIEVDHDTTLTIENFEERTPKASKVMYCYGLRIVGGSRMHLVIAIALLYRALGDRVAVTGGDTDSVKVACDPDVVDDDLLRALQPIADASKRAIDKVQSRVRERYPQFASALDGIGAFDIEGCGDDATRWAWHMEAWNKARVSCDSRLHSHITCAGLSRPDGAYTIETYIDDLLRTDSPEHVFPKVLGYNVFVHNEISHGLQRTRPHPAERFRARVTDYLGRVCDIDSPEAVALYPVGRWLGETDMPANAENARYLHSVYGRDVDVRERTCYVDSAGKAKLVYEEVL